MRNVTNSNDIIRIYIQNYIYIKPIDINSLFFIRAEIKIKLIKEILKFELLSLLSLILISLIFPSSLTLYLFIPNQSNYYPYHLQKLHLSIAPNAEINYSF